MAESGVNTRVNKLTGDLAGVCNNSNLPPSIIRLALMDILAQIRNVEAQVLNNEKAEYEKQLAEEQAQSQAQPEQAEQGS